MRRIIQTANSKTPLFCGRRSIIGSEKGEEFLFIPEMTQRGMLLHPSNEVRMLLILLIRLFHRAQRLFYIPFTGCWRAFSLVRRQLGAIPHNRIHGFLLLDMSSTSDSGDGPERVIHLNGRENRQYCIESVHDDEYNEGRHG